MNARTILISQRDAIVNLTAENAALRADLNDARSNWEAAAEELRQADASTAANAGDQGKHIPGNFTTHRAAWREGLTFARDASIGDGAAYWEHEIAAYDRAFARLLDNPEPARPTAVGASDLLDDQRDAARYRWIRNDWIRKDVMNRWVPRHPVAQPNGGTMWYGASSANTYDQSVDRAMRPTANGAAGQEGDATP